MKNVSEISVCIIVKNDEEHIERCLKSIKPFGFTIIVVDTGSVDNTIEISKKYTDKIHKFSWVDDFSKARNYAVELSENDHIIFIDSDEYIEELDLKKLLVLIEENPERVGRIKRKNYLDDSEQTVIKEWINRIFDKKYFMYNGSIHEQVTKKDGEFDFKTYKAPMVIGHTGYQGTEKMKKEKALRNINLLLKELEGNMDDAYVLYQIGKSYYMIKEYEESKKYFEEALSIIKNTEYEYVNDLIITYGYTLINLKEFEKALDLRALYEDFSKTSDFVFLMGLIYMNNAMFEEAVGEFLKAIKYPDDAVYAVGTNSFLANYNIGVIYECLKDYKNAIKFYKNAKGYKKAEERISYISNINP